MTASVLISASLLFLVLQTKQSNKSASMALHKHTLHCNSWKFEEEIQKALDAGFGPESMKNLRLQSDLRAVVREQNQDRTCTASGHIVRTQVF